MAACTPIITGDQFLGRVLEHVDCQAQSLGSYGYQTLAQPGSPAATVVSGLLTIFIALFGIRLLLGYRTSGGDLVSMVLKVGIVLTLAFSWPAFRTVIYDAAITGPASLAAAIAPSGTPASTGDLPVRLENADAAMLRLTEAGAGRNLGAYIDRDAPGGTFEAAALEDENAFGLARLVFLSGIIGSLGLLRILAGLLLAITPLVAGLLLLGWTRGIAAGWARGLVLVTLGGAGLAIVTAVELAVLEPWLADALRVRGLGYATPAAPTELLAMTTGFALVQFGMIWALARVAFHRGWQTIPAVPEWPEVFTAPRQDTRTMPEREPVVMRDRALQIAGGVERIMRHERSSDVQRSDIRALEARGSPAAGSSAGSPRPRLGEAAPRTSGRRTLAARTRDGG